MYNSLVRPRINLPPKNMSQPTNGNGEFSTLDITPELITQIIGVLKDKAYGSIEIYIENHQVVQITERTIRKLKTQSYNSGLTKAPVNRFQLKIQKF